MGVAGLLPVLKPVAESASLERYRGKTVAIDTYSWLHKAVFCCADKIVMDMPTKAYWGYFNKKLNMLRHFQITPYFVLDGDYLPRKAGTEVERENRRDTYKKQALDAHDAGNSRLAFSNFQKACDVSPELAKSLIEEFKAHNIKYIVAPYEADSQLVYLEKIGEVDAIISEDSDLLVFGAQILLTKLNDQGVFVEIRRENFKNCHGSKISTFDDEQLLLMATISGCDYTKGIPKYGIQKAITQVYQFKTYERVILSIRAEGKQIPDIFDDEYKKAKLAFRYQIVYNPVLQKVQHLNPLTDEIIKAYGMEFIISCTGSILDDKTHMGVSFGNLHPHTKQKLLTREEKYGFLEQAPMAQRASTMPIMKPAVSSSSIPSGSTTLRRSNTTQSSIAYRTSKPQPKQRRALINIMNFTNKINKQKSAEVERKDIKQRSVHSPPPEDNPITKRQKKFIFSNVNPNDPKPDEKSKFFQTKLQSATFSLLKREGTAEASDAEDSNETSFNNQLDAKCASNVSHSQTLHRDEENESLVEPQSSGSSTTTIRDDAMINSSDLVMTDLENDEDLPEFKSSTPTKKMKGRHLVILDEMKDIGGETSASTSTSENDVGELNTAYYLHGDGEENGDDSLIEDDSFDDPLNKRNMLDEIYSFKKSIPPHLPIQQQFSPENFISKIEKNRHRPSPLSGQRKPLGEINVNTTAKASALDRFRFNRSNM